MLYFVYFKVLLYNAWHSVGISSGRCFLKGGWYSQQIISAVAKASLTFYSLTHKVPETYNL